MVTLKQRQCHTETLQESVIRNVVVTQTCHSESLMSVLSVSVSNRLVSDYYSPIVCAEYTTGGLFTKSTHRREVMREHSTGKWFFVEGREPCSDALSRELTVAYNNVIQVRRSSYPPPRLEETAEGFNHLRILGIDKIKPFVPEE